MWHPTYRIFSLIHTVCQQILFSKNGQREWSSVFFCCYKLFFLQIYFNKEEEKKQKKTHFLSRKKLKVYVEQAK